MALEDLAGYSLRRGLGSGSVGTVWLLRDLASGRHAVLKRVPKTSIPSVEAFTEDVALARSIDHPHVARLLDVRESEGEWLLISQYVAAGTLAALLERRGPLSLGELVTLISPLAQGLAAMHRAGLVHGHLGLRDVMFDADGRPVITDAGLRLQKYPGSPAADLAALGDIARHAGGPPTVFPDTLFTGDGDHISRRILQLAPPEPIHLGQTSAHPTPPTSPAAEGAEPTPHNAADENAADETTAEMTAIGGSTRDPSAVRPADRPGSPRRGLANAPSTSGSGRRGMPTRKAGRPAAGKRSTRRRVTPSRDRSTGKRRLAYGVLVIGAVVAVTVLMIGLVAVGVVRGPAASSVAANKQPTANPTTNPSTPKSPNPTASVPSAVTSPRPTGRSGSPRPTVGSGSPRPTAGSSSPGAVRAEEVWLRTLRGLDLRRAQAFSTLDQTELDRVYVPGTAPWASDRSLLASYRHQQIRVDGLRVQIESLVIEHPGDKTVVLRIVDRLIAGTTITSTGQRTPLPPGPPTSRRLTLNSHNTTWRISAITTT